MQPDSVSRALLALILVCLVILIVRGVSDAGFQPGWGRFSVTGMRAGAPVLIRTDTVTGQVWKLELRGGGNKWVAFTEPDAEPVQSAGRESAPPPSRTAVAEREIVEPPEDPRPGVPTEHAGSPPPPTSTARPNIDVPRGSQRRAASGPDAAALAPGEISPELDEEALRFMTELSEPEHPVDVRAWVVEQLARERGPQATAILVSILDDPEPSLVLSSLDALADRREDPGVREALERHRSHSDPRVARGVQELLDTTGGSTAPR